MASHASPTVAPFPTRPLGRTRGAERVFSFAPLIEIGLAIAARLPRGRGAVPRLMARTLLRDRTYMASMPGGFRMGWNRYSLEMLGHYRKAGEWDQHVLGTLLEVVRPGDIVHDIGANAGFMSLSLMAEIPNLRIFAFEPLPRLAGGLAESARVNGFHPLTVHEAALSDRTGTTDFYLPAHAIHASLVAVNDRAQRLEVPTYRMDDLIESGEILPPNVIKMDVEGGEMRVVDGAARTLSRWHPKIVYECDGGSQRFGHGPGDMIRRLAGLGYNRFEYLNHRDRRSVDADSAEYGDFLAWREV